MAGGEVVAVADDGTERLGDGPCRGLAAHEVLVDAKALEAAMQPPGPSRIGVALGDKGAVFERDGLGHGSCAACAGCAFDCCNLAISSSNHARSSDRSVLSG